LMPGEQQQIGEIEAIESLNSYCLKVEKASRCTESLVILQ
jgi:hypothetical protein